MFQYIIPNRHKLLCFSCRNLTSPLSHIIVWLLVLSIVHNTSFVSLSNLCVDNSINFLGKRPRGDGGEIYLLCWYLLCSIQLRNIELELHNAPARYRNEVNRRLGRYRAELTRLRQNMVETSHACVR